jgi:hypothetical protein
MIPVPGASRAGCGVQMRATFVFEYVSVLTVMVLSVVETQSLRAGWQDRSVDVDSGESPGCGTRSTDLHKRFCIYSFRH